MNQVYYDMIFKRKSFHVFKDIIPLTNQEIRQIEAQIQNLVPLLDDIKVEIKVIHKSQTTCKRGEYCILIYSETKGNYLQNVGYLGEQLDLWLTAQNIGTCWYGVGKPFEEKHNDLDFVIMIAIAKTDVKNFRKDYRKSKRKSLEETWNGDDIYNISDIIRYAPSACNTQPWYFESHDKRLSLYRIKSKRGVMPLHKVSYYNRIDIGIMMLFLDICLIHEGYNFNKELYSDFLGDGDKTLDAAYILSNY